VAVIRYDTGDGRATITIDDPERRNPLSNEAMAAVAAAVDDACNDSEVRVIVITGAGDRAFSAGGDLSGGFMDTPIAGHGSRESLAGLFRALRRCPKPVVARVNGHALGGGFGLAAACDIVIAVDDALMGTPEVRVGLWPMMISAILKELVPQKALFEMMATGRRFPASEGVALGVVSRAVAREDLDSAVDETIAMLMQFSPATLALGKASFYAIAHLDVDSALDHLHIGLTATGTTADAVEGIAAFIQKRDPQWSGH
jgi:enoyl-CoA hydratase/carnithine racemase